MHVREQLIKVVYDKIFPNFFIFIYTQLQLVYYNSAVILALLSIM